MNFKFLSKERLLSAQIFGQAFKYLVEKYEQSKNILTPASPFSQILHVLSEISELIFYYIENALTELNFMTARNRESIYGLSRLTGHNPTRGISAFGKVALKLKSGIDKEIVGDYIIIPKYTKIMCLTNNLPYFLFLDKDNIILEKGDTSFHHAQIYQGTIESQQFVSQGRSMESHSLTTKDMTDHFQVEVFINGKKWEKYESLYDMMRGDEGVIVKTGISGGLDVYFGSENFGTIPAEGSIIEIQYIKINGRSGNIGNSNEVILKYEDSGFDKYGNEIDLNEVLMTSILMPPSFGSDSEPLDFTRLIAPKASKSFVLARPDNYIYFLRRYNFFSVIDAYSTFDDQYLNDDNIVYLFLLPDISRKVTTDVDYFTLDQSEFTLTPLEKEHIFNIIEESQQQLISSELRLVDPIIKYYAINIIITHFENKSESNLRSEIRTKLSEYFLTVRRRDKIPRSDIIALIENIDGIDSVNVTFVSKENELALIRGYYYVPVEGYDTKTNTKKLLTNKKITLKQNENPNLGLDEFGDIVIKEKEVPIIRGGWRDRNNKFYEIYPEPTKLSSLNIIFKGEVKYDLYNRITENNRKKLK